MMYLGCGWRMRRWGTGRSQRCSSFFRPGRLPQSHSHFPPSRWTGLFRDAFPPSKFSLFLPGVTLMTSVDNTVRTASQAWGCVPQRLSFGTCLGPQAPSITSRWQFSNWLSKDTQDQGRGLSDPGPLRSADSFKSRYNPRWLLNSLLFSWIKKSAQKYSPNPTGLIYHLQTFSALLAK